MTMKTQSTNTESVFAVDNITVKYSTGQRVVTAVDDVSLTVADGETLGLVGESGCGKSSLGRSMVMLPPPTQGTVRLRDLTLTDLTSRELRRIRHRVQMVFQDPISSLNPRRTGVDIVAEPLRVRGHSSPKIRAIEILEEVGIDKRMAARRPHELSGGQCQRVSIARAIVQEPEVLVCDEAVSALDVSVQAQVLNLLELLKVKHRLSIVFIAHNLAAVKNISDRVAVMYLGKVCEIATSSELYVAPRHHYTAALLAAVPQSKNSRSRVRVSGDVSAGYAGVGCRFATRCQGATARCTAEDPELLEISVGHHVACHNPL